LSQSDPPRRRRQLGKSTALAALAAQRQSRQQQRGGGSVTVAATSLATGAAWRAVVTIRKMNISLMNRTSNRTTKLCKNLQNRTLFSRRFLHNLWYNLRYNKSHQKLYPKNPLTDWALFIMGAHNIMSLVTSRPLGLSFPSRQFWTSVDYTLGNFEFKLICSIPKFPGMAIL
jgi:hypothetical protein